MSITIYHNPKCSSSRNTLALIRDAGFEPEVIEYLKTPPNRNTIRDLVSSAGLTLREAMRDKEALYLELGLADVALTSDDLLDAIDKHPVLLNRPFVVTPEGARLCRPAEKVLEILPGAQ